jgi:DNA processing protein
LLLKSPGAVSKAWALAHETLNLSLPLEAGAGVAIGRFDLDDETVRDALAKVTRFLASLDQDDLILSHDNRSYPELLAKLPDCPRFIFVRGRVEILNSPGIAVVGTRNPSDEGAARARKLGFLLAKFGITVFSGLAKGIDANAHLGALEAGGDTVAVIGTPLNRFYPAENEQLQRRIAKVGAVVSQFCPGFATTRASFPIRNATMSGLSLGTVVVEASETSGALIQAKRCVEQGRKLFIPHSALINSSISWPRKLVDKGAIVFRTIDELVSSLEDERLLPRPTPSEPALVSAGAGAT